MERTIDLFGDIHWQNADEYPEGTRKRVLYSGKDAKTYLMEFPSGFYMAPHSHLSTEQHFILEGSYTSDGRRYFRGTYRFFSAHENHGPFTSEQGALVLIIRTPYDAEQ